MPTIEERVHVQQHGCSFAIGKPVCGCSIGKTCDPFFLVFIPGEDLECIRGSLYPSFVMHIKHWRLGNNWSPTMRYMHLCRQGSAREGENNRHVHFPLGEVDAPGHCRQVPDSRCADILPLPPEDASSCPYPSLLNTRQQEVHIIPGSCAFSYRPSSFWRKESSAYSDTLQQTGRTSRTESLSYPSLRFLSFCGLLHLKDAIFNCKHFSYVQSHHVCPHFSVFPFSYEIYIFFLPVLESGRTVSSSYLPTWDFGYI